MDIDKIKDQYTCLICQDIFSDPVALSTCGHSFCKTCINDYTDNFKNENSKKSSVPCPNCRTPYYKKDIKFNNNLFNEMKNTLILCECKTKMNLIDYKNHSEKCPIVLQNMKQQLKNNNMQINKDKIQKNRQTFDCTLCQQKNLDRKGYIKHIKQTHPRQKGVCSICKCQPWGDPNYITNILEHINKRHKFDYDTMVDYNNDEDEVLQRVLQESLNDK